MQPSIPWSSSVSVFVIKRTAIIHSLKCTVPFSLVVPLLSLAVTHCYLLSLVVIRYITRCHSLSLVAALVVTRCHSLLLVLLLVVTLYHLLYHSLSLVVIRCHSFSFVVTRCTTRCDSLYNSLSLVVTRCTTRLSFYKQSPIIPLLLSHHAVKFSGDSPCGSGNSSRGLRWPYDPKNNWLIYIWWLLIISHHIVKLDGHLDITFFICEMIYPRDQRVMWLVDNIFSSKVIYLSSGIAIGVVQVEM